MGDYPAVAVKAQQVKDMEDLLAVMTPTSVEKILVYYNGENVPYECTEEVCMGEMVTTLRRDITDEKNVLVAEIKTLADC